MMDQETRVVYPITTLWRHLQLHKSEYQQQQTPGYFQFVQRTTLQLTLIRSTRKFEIIANLSVTKFLVYHQQCFKIRLSNWLNALSLTIMLHLLLLNFTVDLLCSLTKISCYLIVIKKYFIKTLLRLNKAFWETVKHV